MNKLELISALKKDADISKSEAAKIVQIFFDSMSDALTDGERIENRHFRHEIHFDEELASCFRKNETGEIVGLGILLPIDKVFLRRKPKRVAKDAGATVRRGAEPDDLRPEQDGPVVAIMRPMVEGDVDGHASASEQAGSLP